LEDFRLAIELLKRIMETAEEIDFKMDAIDKSYTLLSTDNILVSTRKPQTG
jgi:hypothetical protein